MDVAHTDPPDDEPLLANQFVLLDVNEVEPNPFQPRRDFGQAEIDSLAESLREHEQLQPILVRQVDGRFQLISGERRWRAAKKAGLAHIKAQVRDADDRLVAELAIVENLQRKDLNAIEKALSFKRYLDEHDCTQEDLGKRLKIDRSTIANLLRLLELPGPVQDALRDGKISAGHARALLPLGDDRAQVEFSKRIQQEGVSVRATEQQVQELIAREDAEPLSVSTKTKAARTRNQQIASLEQELRSALGAKVDIRNGAGGRGRIVIHFKGHDEFERLHAYLMDGDYDGIVGEAS
jgi:ParB family chromosome partitioning protein